VSDARHDAVVLGAGPSGLVAAALLARRRLRVLVVDEEGKRPGTSHGYAFTRHMPLLFGFGAHQPMDDFFTDIGVPLIAKKSIRPLPFAYQVILPRARLDLCADPALLEEELAREFPKHAESLKSFYAELERIEKGVRRLLSSSTGIPPRGLRERWALRRLARREDPELAFYQDRGIAELAGGYGFDDTVETFLRAQLAALGHQAGDTMSAWEGAVMLSLFRGGGSTCAGGEDAILDMIRHRITALHGSFYELPPGEKGAPAGRLVIGGRRVEQVILGEEVVTADAVVACLPPERLARWLPETFWTRGYVRRLAGSAPAATDLSFHFAIESEVIPVGMADQVIFVADPSRSLVENNLLRLRLSPEEEPGAATQGRRALSVTLAADPARLLDDPAYPDALLQAVRRHIESFMHFARGRYELLETHPTREELGSPCAGDASRWEPASERRLAALPAALPPLANLYVVGRAVFPALGFLGELYVGRAAADRIIERIST
jgi:phytoene dehydrogenase-like protein